MFTWLVIISGGILAGLITGLVGGSAALVVTPFMTGFLGVDAFSAIGLALATDVFASAASTITYAKEGYVQIKRSLLMVIFAALGSIIGTWISTFIDNTALTSVSSILTLLIGINFLVNANKEKSQKTGEVKDPKREQIINITVGLFLGTFCGFVGAGGGMMILAVLTMVLGYELKPAVATSVLIMTFTALTGSIAHFLQAGIFPLVAIIVSGTSSIIGAYIGASFVAKSNDATVKKSVGILLIIIFALTLTMNIMN